MIKLAVKSSGSDIGHGSCPGREPVWDEGELSGTVRRAREQVVVLVFNRRKTWAREQGGGGGTKERFWFGNERMCAADLPQCGTTVDSSHDCCIGQTGQRDDGLQPNTTTALEALKNRTTRRRFATKHIRGLDKNTVFMDGRTRFTKSVVNQGWCRLCTGIGN